MQKVRLHLSYDGTDFFGWQKQKTKHVTIQGSVEKALAKIFDQPVRLIGSGRTDAGVHALRQVAHFACPKPPEHFNLYHALNSLTPSSIVVHEVFLAPEDFHAQASAERKTYKYLILNTPLPSAFRRAFTTWERRPIELEYLQLCSQFLLGKHDFKSFQTKGTEVSSTVREVHEASWLRHPGGILEFTITGDGFLKQMVRNIVGTVVEMHYAKDKPSKIQGILQAKDRQAAGTTAQPQGLYLQGVQYPIHLDRKCRKL